MEIIPTRSALLEARDEHHVMHEGFRFLDEKRVLLAAEIVRQFEQYREANRLFAEAHTQAAVALEQAVVRHGFLGVQVYPAHPNDQATLKSEKKIFFGVPLIEGASLRPGKDKPVKPPVNPSPEANLCRRLFVELLHKSIPLAALSGNLHRLLAEYKRTERRARALEDVILPELEETIREIDVRLEELEQEESVRVRLHKVES